MHSQTPDIIPFPLPFRTELLTQAQLETLKGGTLRLLEEVGVHFPSPQALEIFAQHGAHVDKETAVHRFEPAHRIDTLSKIPCMHIRIQ